MAPTAHGGKRGGSTGHGGASPATAKPVRRAKRLVRTAKRNSRTGEIAVIKKRRMKGAKVDAANRLAHAIEALSTRGVLAGVKSRRISTRVDPGLVEEAKRRTGLQSDADVITAALAIMAAGDDFGAWLVSRSTPFPEDFELAL